jgi:hypothetical protein
MMAWILSGHARPRSQACADCVNLSALPGIHVFSWSEIKDVDGRDKPGHDGLDSDSMPGHAVKLAQTA